MIGLCILATVALYAVASLVIMYLLCKFAVKEPIQ